MKVQDFGVPIDVLWYRVPKSAGDPTPSLGRVRNGKILITIDRGDYFQCASIIPKGAFEEIQRQGLEAFRAGIASAAPFLADTHAASSTDWDKVKLLTVQVNRLRDWHRPGLLCIGDAAHAMSPAGGVGINLAVQDAVAAANLLAAKLRTGAGHRGRPPPRAAAPGDAGPPHPGGTGLHPPPHVRSGRKALRPPLAREEADRPAGAPAAAGGRAGGRPRLPPGAHRDRWMSGRPPGRRFMNSLVLSRQLAVFLADPPEGGFRSRSRP